MTVAAFVSRRCIGRAAINDARASCSLTCIVGGGGGGVVITSPLLPPLIMLHLGIINRPIPTIDVAIANISININIPHYDLLLQRFDHPLEAVYDLSDGLHGQTTLQHPKLESRYQRRLWLSYKARYCASYLFSVVVIGVGVAVFNVLILTSSGVFGAEEEGS